MTRMHSLLLVLIISSIVTAQDQGFDLTGITQKPKTPEAKPIGQKSSRPVPPKDDAAELFELAKDPRAIWYDRSTLKSVYQNSGQLWIQGYNIAGALDKTGTANNEAPWLHTGGLDDCGPAVSVKRMLWTPVGSKIKLWNVAREIKGGPRNGLDYSVIVGKYPVGTVSAEFMYDGVRMFEARTRTKISNTGDPLKDWETDQHEWGAKPRGYVAVTSCTECHEDIGKHSFEIDPVRDWYATVRGLEPGGPIHWHPWKTDKVGGRGTTPLLRDEVKAFVEYAHK